MNYTAPPSSIIQDTPFNNPYTKVACGIGLAWLGYMGVKYAKKGESTEPQSRKSRQGFTSSKIDKSIDHRNHAFGKPVPANPSVPFYSRHNYNRRRRSKNFW